MKLTGMISAEHVLAAYHKLSPEEQKVIDQQAKKLIKVMESRRLTKDMFGRLSALELLAKIGIWMNERER